MTNSINTSNFGSFGVLTLGREFGGALKDFGEHIGAKMGMAIEEKSKELGHLFDAVEFIQEEGSALAEAYSRNIFNTQRAMFQANKKVNGPEPKFDSKF